MMLKSNSNMPQKLLGKGPKVSSPKGASAASIPSDPAVVDHGALVGGLSQAKTVAKKKA